jgi:hypothetical protein
VEEAVAAPSTPLGVKGEEGGAGGAELVVGETAEVGLFLF